MTTEYKVASCSDCPMLHVGCCDECACTIMPPMETLRNAAGTITSYVSYPFEHDTMQEVHEMCPLKKDAVLVLLKE